MMDAVHMTAPANHVRYGLLGPLQVSVDGQPLQIAAGRQRALLALLLAAAGRAVSEDGLIDGLWGAEPPASARNSLQSHISRLRAALAPAGDRLQRVAGAYRLELAAGELDVDRVEALLAEARAIRGEAPAAAAGLLADAWACWRGPALADLADVPGLQAERVRLEELRLVVRDELLDAQLAAGRHAQVVLDAERAAAEEPLRERTQLLLARALYAHGRQADALAALRRYRDRLAEETGLDPSDELDRLQRAILGRAAHLHPPAGAGGDGPPGAEPSVLSAVLSPPATPFFGREAELARLAECVRANRLVTVVGVGGVGKTRLVLEALPTLGEVAGRPLLLDLSALRQPADVTPALAALLGVRAGPNASLEEAVVEYLTTARLLLLIDNCEHLLPAVARLVGRIVRGAPAMTVLATSRQRLGVDGEQVFELPPLPLPGSDELLGGRPVSTPSMLLFADRAARVRRGFRLTQDNSLLVGRICRHLDGLPLALELAAGMTAALGLADLHDRLDRRLDLLRSPIPARDAESARHTSLRSVLDWSYELLGQPERRLFARLAVFDGGFDLAAVEQVAGPEGGEPVAEPIAEGLVRLVDASLVVAEESGHHLRYHLLDTVRHYGLERLAASGELDAVARRHTAWAVTVAETAERHLRGPQEAQWAQRLDAEFANLRSAWHRALDGGDLDSAARITVALSWWQERTEVWRWARILATRQELAGTPYEGAVLGSAAQAAWFMGEPEVAEELARAGLRSSGTAAGGRWRCLNVLAAALLVRGEFDQSASLWEQLATDAEVPAAVRPMMGAFSALPLMMAGRIGSAEVRARVQPAADSGWPTAAAFACYFAAEARRLANPPGAIRDLEAAISMAQAVGSRYIEGVATVSLVAAAISSGDSATALRRLPGLLRLWQQTGSWIQQWTTLRTLAGLLADLEVDEPAAVILGATQQAPGVAVVAALEAPVRSARIGQLQARMGPERFARAAAHGAAMARAQVVEFALHTLASQHGPPVVH
jgi:predicted ATPase/DNA-binding SARP family transcriptional activator